MTPGGEFSADELVVQVIPQADDSSPVTPASWSDTVRISPARRTAKRTASHMRAEMGRLAPGPGPGSAGQYLTAPGRPRHKLVAGHMVSTAPNVPAERPNMTILLLGPVGMSSPGFDSKECIFQLTQSDGGGGSPGASAKGSSTQVIPWSEHASPRRRA